MVLTTPESVIEMASTQSLLDDLIDESVRTIARKPIMMQFDPSSRWIWRRWKGTVFSKTWRACVRNMLVACVFIGLYQNYAALPQALGGFNILWGQLLSVTTFTLTFFLNVSYGLWRKCYELSRRLQGRLLDLSLTLAAHAQRIDPGGATAAGDPQQQEEEEETHLGGTTRTKRKVESFEAPEAPPPPPPPTPPACSVYSPSARLVLQLIGRYIRVFNMFTYASFTRSHRPILTPPGMRRLVERGILTPTERQVLVDAEIPATQFHSAVILWIVRVFVEARQAGHFLGSAGFEEQFLEKCHVIRAQYGAMADELQGRMPLAYAHIVQVLVDVILYMYPFMALSSGLTPLLAVLGTGLLTLFYQGLFDLAKQFLDPYDNENFNRGEDPLCVDTLVAETNAGSVRWMLGFEEQPFDLDWLEETVLPLRGYSVETVRERKEAERLLQQQQQQQQEEEEEEEAAAAAAEVERLKQKEKEQAKRLKQQQQEAEAEQEEEQDDDDEYDDDDDDDLPAGDLELVEAAVVAESLLRGSRMAMSSLSSSSKNDTSKSLLRRNDTVVVVEQDKDKEKEKDGTTRVLHTVTSLENGMPIALETNNATRTEEQDVAMTEDLEANLTLHSLDSHHRHQESSWTTRDDPLPLEKQELDSVIAVRHDNATTSGSTTATERETPETHSSSSSPLSTSSAPEAPQDGGGGTAAAVVNAVLSDEKLERVLELWRSRPPATLDGDNDDDDDDDWWTRPVDVAAKWKEEEEEEEEEASRLVVDQDWDELLQKWGSDSYSQMIRDGLLDKGETLDNEGPPKRRRSRVSPQTTTTAAAASDNDRELSVLEMDGEVVLPEEQDDDDDDDVDKDKDDDPNALTEEEIRETQAIMNAPPGAHAIQEMEEEEKEKSSLSMSSSSAAAAAAAAAATTTTMTTSPTPPVMAKEKVDEPVGEKVNGSGDAPPPPPPPPPPKPQATQQQQQQEEEEEWTEKEIRETQAILNAIPGAHAIEEDDYTKVDEAPKKAEEEEEEEEESPNEEESLLVLEMDAAAEGGGEDVLVVAAAEEAEANTAAAAAEEEEEEETMDEAAAQGTEEEEEVEEEEEEEREKETVTAATLSEPSPEQ